MNHRELALVEGWSDTRATLLDWNRAPFRVLGSWVGVSVVIAVLLLAAVGAVGSIMRPDPTLVGVDSFTSPGTMDDVWPIVGRNLLVLALHSMACVAGFIAKSSLPREAESYSGWWRWVHDRAAPAAIAFVALATLFSLSTQSFALGARLSTVSEQLGTAPIPFLLALTPHALPELAALFLPLAAWLLAARAKRWEQLLAATIATTLFALPVVVAAAAIEVFVTPEVLRALHFV